jgi:hypothetical protein
MREENPIYLVGTTAMKQILILHRTCITVKRDTREGFPGMVQLCRQRRRIDNEHQTRLYDVDHWNLRFHPDTTQHRPNYATEEYSKQAWLLTLDNWAEGRTS